MSLSTTGFELAHKRTWKREVLDEMELVMPCLGLLGLIEQHAPRGKNGRQPFPISTMVRIHFIQLWFGLSDRAMEESLHDIPLYRELAGLDAGVTRLPDESTILWFRHLLEKHELSARGFATINAILAKHGLLHKAGTVVDATLIAASSSTKYKSGECDPEMHQTQKGNQWNFGMKAHIGVDADSGLVHTVIGIAANVGDVTQGHALLPGEEVDVFADAGYHGAAKRPEATGVDWHIAMRPGKHPALDKETKFGAMLDKIEKLMAGIRAKVEHQFRVIKRQFSFTKVRYRGLVKNTSQLLTLFALRNM